MKANAKELFEVVRQVVRDELRKVLPEMVKNHLTETYIKRMVSEASNRPASKSGGLAELLAPQTEDTDEEIPHPQKNSDRGIYNPDKLTKPENRNEHVRKLVQDAGPLGFVFEGVKQPQEEGGTPDIPIDSIAPGMDFNRMNRLVEGMDSRSKGSIPTSHDAKMRELEMKRKALDVPVSGKR